MRSLLISVLACSLMAACGGDGSLSAPTCAVVPQSHPDTHPCIYQVPAEGQKCADVYLVVDGVSLDAAGFDLVCGAGQVVVLDEGKCGEPHVVEACW